MLMQPSHRFLFALVPPLALRRQIANAAVWFDEGRGALAPDRLHTTLFITDDSDGIDRNLLDRLVAIGDRIRADPFAMTFDQVVGGDRSIAIRPRTQNASFAALHRQLCALGQETGVAERRDHRSSPHLTLGYRNGRGFAEPIAPVTWQVEEVVLILSHLGRARHEVVGRWPLTGGGDPDQLSLF